MINKDASVLRFSRLARKRKGSFVHRINFFRRFDITKRHKFIISVVVLSFGLFASEYIIGKSGILLAVVLALCTNLFLFWSNRQDIKENFSWSIFILPFFYSLSFALFFLLVPNRFITRAGITTFYGVGLYSLFLSQNIFTVASIRTIALLSSARTVSFILSLISYFFLADVVLSLDLPIIPTALSILVFSYFLIAHSIWTYILEKPLFTQWQWNLVLSVCLSEVSFILWFWPTNPTIVALFLSGFFYTTVGLSHLWFEKRLFRGVLWEYIWVGVIVFCLLMLSTSWKG
ncbi:MAG: hypothetical protein Q8P80_03170 [Candidatus Levybacteria bacterium]|nr:hypothetical protein [Candidatus Levybacteria bacterium]